MLSTIVGTLMETVPTVLVKTWGVLRSERCLEGRSREETDLPSSKWASAPTSSGDRLRVSAPPLLEDLFTIIGLGRSVQQQTRRINHCARKRLAANLNGRTPFRLTIAVVDEEGLLYCRMAPRHAQHALMFFELPDDNSLPTFF